MSRILAAGAARMKMEAENYEARIAALEAQLAELAAENERLKLECAEYREIAARKSNQVAGIIRAEAISRTGAVKALEWTEYETDGWADRADAEAGSFGVFYNIDIQTDGYRVVFDHEAVGAIGTFDTADEAKAAAQADYERRILSALDTHPRATNTVDAHETANVSDKPEGQQEAVATVAKVNAAGASWNTVYPADALDKLPIGTPLYTRPSEQAVTDAMIAAAADEIVDTAEIDFNGTIINRLDVASAALKAAMEAGR